MSGGPRVGWDHPRIRGEHQRRPRRQETVLGSSPHTRGAQRPEHAGDDHVRIIPAYAGSTLPRDRFRDDRQDHPRIRGEHSPVDPSYSKHEGSSPHTRGARADPSENLMDRGIIPAYAGSTAASSNMPPKKRDHPRIRGEHGSRLMKSPGSSWIIPAYAGSTGWPAHHIKSSMGSSPHTRGALERAGGPPAQERIIPAYAGSTGLAFPLQPSYSWIIPAYAGSTPGWAKSSTIRRDHPRIRGEHRSRRCWRSRGIGSSPHTRGALYTSLWADRDFGIIPAYAGSTGWPAHHIKSSMGSSPHTRGARLRRGTGRRPEGIIPAYAGSTSPPSGASPGRADHPRIRGEHYSPALLTPSTLGSSPHTRGAPLRASASASSCRIIPAYAGSTRDPCQAEQRHQDHPRIRGEHSPAHRRRRRPRGSSPHTRGAPDPARRPDPPRRIIPAYAGSTLPASAGSSAVSDHPRIRGEHGHRHGLHDPRHGSSPHTRGAPWRPPTSRTAPGIIPAYAGSTH